MGFGERFFGRRPDTAKGADPKKGPETDQKNESRSANPEVFEGVVTDQRLLQFLYEKRGREVHAIATDRFLDKSKGEYNSAWLARELVQNFVDHNPEHPGTLDGVAITSTTLPDGNRRFVIQGDWAFPDPTGVLSPHSDKPAEQNTAGGNGIGLKQTAIRLMRDFGARRFQIQGEGWQVDYQLARAEQVNQELAKYTGENSPQQVRHDWLLADIENTQARGKTTYVIETTDPELISTLEQLPTLGVSRENPFLKDPDFENEYGALKWLGEDAIANQEASRLFINGQVMNYRTKGDSAEHYWHGPEAVTIRLNNISYRMNIDRPPVDQYDLGRYVDTLVNSMTKDELITQLQRSEKLWPSTVTASYSNKPGFAVVLEKMLNIIRYKGYNDAEYENYFPNRRYLSLEARTSRGQIADLEEQGYVVLPSNFKSLGVPSVDTKLDTIEVASNAAPATSSYEREKVAKEVGVQVNYEVLEDVKTVDDYLKTIKVRLLDTGAEISLKPGTNTVSIGLNTEIPKALAIRPTNRQDTEAKRLLHFVRGLAARGLAGQFDGTGFASRVYLAQKDYLLNFGLVANYGEDDELLQRLVDVNSGASRLTIELKPEYYPKAEEILGAASKANPAETSSSLGQVVPAPKGEEDKPTEGLTSPRVTIEKKDPEPKEATTYEEISWSAEEQQQLELIRQKAPQDYTDEDRAVLQKYARIKNELDKIPITTVSPEGKTINRGTVTVRVATVDEREQQRLARLEAQMPGLIEAVNKLDQAVPEAAAASKGNPRTLEQYLQWRGSDNFYGQLAKNAHYLKGRHLLDILDDYNQAEISGVVTRQTGTLAKTDAKLSALREKIKGVAKRFAIAEHEVSDFEIVFSPNEAQLAQLELLYIFAQLTTGADVPNDLFIYKGSGSKGININKKAIGLHESLFTVSFSEIFRTFIHEIAHNEAMDHGNQFRHVMESLFSRALDSQSALTDKLISGSPLSDEERVVVDIRKTWDTLRTQAAPHQSVEIDT